MIAFRKNKTAAFLSVLLAVILAVTGCGSDEPAASDFTPEKEKVFLEAAPGRYCMAEAVYPGELDSPIPLVAIGHGFTAAVLQNSPRGSHARESQLSAWILIQE